MERIQSSKTLTLASYALTTELVRKIETSPPKCNKKRKNTACKKLRRAIKEQRRYAKTAKLRAVAVTLKYQDIGACSRKHISRFIDNLRRQLQRKGYILPYAWVLERASQLHYHLIIWLPRCFVLTPAKLKKMWPWGDTYVEACRSVDAWRAYITKFDSVAKLPKRARLYGYGGLDDEGAMEVLRSTLPRWLLELLPPNHRTCRRRGGGWIDTTTGNIYVSPYVWTPRGTKLRSVSPPTYH